MIKIPFLSAVLFVHWALSYLKYVLILAPLIRAFERAANFMTCHLMMQTFATNKVTSKFHAKHDDFNYLLDSKG